jgi:hypothetical protein
MLSASSDPKMAMNAASFSNEDGRVFASQATVSSRSLDARLRYRLDGDIYDGVLFNPGRMEEKWALYFHDGRVICVRSWQRRVQIAADTRRADGALEIVRIHGSVFNDSEPPSFTIRALDFLIATHAMLLPWPAPLPPDVPAGDREAALFCLSAFGAMAEVAVRGELRAEPPKRPLRTDSLLHIAAARGELDRIRQLVAGGWPVDLRSRSGLTPLHWAIEVDGIDAATVLLDIGADPNVTHPDGFTPLDYAAKHERKTIEALLRARGGV